MKRKHLNTRHFIRRPDTVFGLSESQLKANKGGAKENQNTRSNPRDAGVVEGTDQAEGEGLEGKAQARAFPSSFSGGFFTASITAAIGTVDNSVAAESLQLPTGLHRL